MFTHALALLIPVLLAPSVALSLSTDPASASRPALAASAEPVLPAPPGCTLVNGARAQPLSAAAAPAAFLPAQLEVRTPFDPTAFPSAGRTYLIYELHLRNLADEPMELRGIEVIGEGGFARPIASFGADQLPSLFFPRAHQFPPDEANASRQLVSAQTAVAYVCLAFEPGFAVPIQLRHRVLLKDAYADGPAIGTRHSRLRTLAPPVAGPDWIAAGGPGNTSHHRVGLLVIEGNARISRRYAIDWRQVRNQTTFEGDAADARSYHAYGETVFAVADGIVVSAKDGMPDNIPRTAKGFETALPLTMENVAGNTVTLDLGGGQFALYAHLEPGSVRVKKGDRVERGQALGRIGNSGDSREPHLHFEVVDSPDLLAGEGLPYLIDRYEIRSADGDTYPRVDELPMLEMLINFRPVESLHD
jgi:murein DD-endopeptidase MepM/ murein hydrolase activator NlpD